jgi:hypothetical protein
LRGFFFSGVGEGLGRTFAGVVVVTDATFSVDVCVFPASQALASNIGRATRTTTRTRNI